MQAVVLMTKIIIYLVVGNAFALEYQSSIKLDSLALYRDFSQAGFSKYQNTTDAFFVGNFKNQFREKEFNFEVAPELRALASQTLDASDTDVAHLSIKAPRRFLDLETKIHGQDRSESYLDFDRLLFSYVREDSEFVVGRRPVGLGVLKHMPVWNKFSRSLPFASGIPQIFSTDQIGVRFQKDSISAQALSVVGPSTVHDGVHLGELTYYGGGTELHLLGARWLDHPAGGFALAQDIWGATFRMEYMHWWPRIGQRRDFEAQTQAGAGLEYAFSESLSAVSEFLYLSRGQRDEKSYTILMQDRINPGLRARYYGLLQLNYQISSFWSSGVGVFKNLVDPSQYFLFRLKYSISDHADFSVDANLPTGKKGGEFSRKTFTYINGAYLGAQASAQAMLSLNY